VLGLLHNTTASETLLGSSRRCHCCCDGGSSVLGGAGVLNVLLKSADLCDGDLGQGGDDLSIGV